MPDLHRPTPHPLQASSPSAEPLPIVARGLTRRYATPTGPVLALQGLDLDVLPGTVTALLGPNGAGKSTLVNLLLGRLQPDAGTVQVAGEVPGSLAARRRTGAMLQAAALAAPLTVCEHIDLHRRYYPRPRSLDDTLALAGLTTLADRRYDALSGGQQRRVQLALALCGQPALLVLDEPTTALDPESRRTLWGTVRRLADEGATVLLTTHQLEEAEALADRVLLLAGGRLRADGTPGAIRAQVADRSVRCISRLDLPALQRLPGVRKVTPSGRHVVLSTAAAEATLRALLAADEAVAELEVTGTSLEDAVQDLLDREAA